MREEEVVALWKELTEQFDEEVANKTITRYLTALKEGEVIAKPLHWCRTVARNIRIDAARRARRTVALDVDENGEPVLTYEGGHAISVEAVRDTPSQRGIHDARQVANALSDQLTPEDILRLQQEVVEEEEKRKAWLDCVRANADPRLIAEEETGTQMLTPAQRYRARNKVESKCGGSRGGGRRLPFIQNGPTRRRRPVGG